MPRASDVQAAPTQVDRAALGFFRRSTIRVRLSIAFLSIAIVIVGLGLLGAWQLQVLADAAAEHPDPQALAAASRAGQAVVLGASLGLFVLCFVLCYPLTVAIVKPIRVAARIAGRVAGGDLTQQVRTGGTDEAMRPLPSFVHIITVPVSAMSAFAPDIPAPAVNISPRLRSRIVCTCPRTVTELPRDRLGRMSSTSACTRFATLARSVPCTLT